MGPVVTIPEPEQVFGPWAFLREMKTQLIDLEKRVRELENKAYLLMWLVGIFGTVGVGLLTAILAKLIL